MKRDLDIFSEKSFPTENATSASKLCRNDNWLLLVF